MLKNVGTRSEPGGPRIERVVHVADLDGSGAVPGGSPAHDAGVDAAEGRPGLESRLATDARLVALLARHRFSGPLYEEFESNLYRYGLPILVAWLKTGEIFKQCRLRDLRLGAPPRPFTPEDRLDLANSTIAAALPVFRRKSLIEGGWDPAKGAALTTYFVNGLPVHFSNVYRAWSRQVRKEMLWQNRMEPESSLADIPDATGTTDPQALYVIRESVREGLDRLDTTTRSVLMMLNEGYQYTEIGEIHGISPRAVEGIIYRHRKRIGHRQESDHE
jgi:DNA-directed RNA polymerase specialized sigma24 family protein